MIVDLLGGRRVSEVELVREIRDLFGKLFERNVFRPGREEADAQAGVNVRFVC
jgi:hypothetical protein